LIVEASKMNKKLSYGRYETNPFLESMLVPVKDKRVKVSPLGKDNNVLVNQETGESFGTHVATFKRVDAEQFIKLFTANVAMTFDLTSAGIKVFSVLCWAVQNKALAKDEVDLDVIALAEFIKQHSDKKPPLSLSIATFKRGLNELEGARIIAKTLRQGRYFINPNFVFNGDRIAFSTVIERDKKSKKKGSEDQLDWLSENDKE
jgi:hypothetical protein